MAAPTLETNAAADTLRITGGTSGDPVTFNDVWNWDDGGGSSAGDGDVPKDGGGTAKVNTFMTEIVADALYTIQKNIWFGNSSDSSYFRSTSEHIYFNDGFVFDVRSAATLQSGILTGNWGEEGSYWNVGPGAVWNLMASQDTAVLLFYDSRLFVRTAQNLALIHGSVTINKGIIRCSSNKTIQPGVGMTLFSVSGLYRQGGGSGCQLAKQPDVFNEYHAHSLNYAVTCGANVVATKLQTTSVGVADIAVMTGFTGQIVDSESALSIPLLLGATSLLFEQYTVNVHVNDSDGANIESATVAATSYGNIVSPTGATPFYRCIEDHTSGVWADDLAADKWEVTSDLNAALAGVTGGAGAGAWVTGIDYVKAAEEFSVSTDADGDITEQTLTRKKWTGISEALSSYAPYTFAVSKAGYQTLTLENIEVNTVLAWVQELQSGGGASRGILTGGRL